MDWQTMIALSFVAFATAYVLRSLFRFFVDSKRTHSGQCGDCPSAESPLHAKPLVPLELTRPGQSPTREISAGNVSDDSVRMH